MAWGRPRDYVLAVFYPILVIGLIGLIAWLSGAVSTAHTDWTHVWVQLASSLVFTFLIAIVTEEGIFRGWLWATLQRGGVTAGGPLVWTSLAFAAWHVSTAVLPTGFRPPLAQVPIYLLNVVVIGFIWGLIRQRSGSILVTAVTHSVWNTLGYVFIGVGTTVGALGIQNSAVSFAGSLSIHRFNSPTTWSSGPRPRRVHLFVAGRQSYRLGGTKPS